MIEINFSGSVFWEVQFEIVQPVTQLRVVAMAACAGSADA